jgi:hypothetical protein
MKVKLNIGKKVEFPHKFFLEAWVQVLMLIGSYLILN